MRVATTCSSRDTPLCTFRCGSLWVLVESLGADSGSDSGSGFWCGFWCGIWVWILGVDFGADFSTGCADLGADF